MFQFYYQINEPLERSGDRNSVPRSDSLRQATPSIGYHASAIEVLFNRSRPFFGGSQSGCECSRGEFLSER